MYAFEPGDSVQWPDTERPAAEGQRSVTVSDAIVRRYQSGKYYVKYLYTDLVDRMIEDMRANVDNDLDNIVTIFGGEGTGKSNLAYYLAKRYDEDFDLSKSLIYTWEQFVTSLTDDPQSVYWFDEAILVAAGRDWMKEANKMLVSSLQTIRFKKLMIIFCIPSLDSIDVYIRQFRTRYAIEAHIMCWPHDREAHRGYAELYVPKSKEEREKLPKDAKAKNFFKSRGFFIHPLMKDNDYDRFKEQASDNNLQAMKDKIGGSSRYQRDKQSLARLVAYMTDVQGMTYQEVAEITGMPYNTVKGMAWRERNKADDET